MAVEPSPRQPPEQARPPEPTAGYPRHWEADVVASDGAVVHLRPIVATDAPKLLALHRRLSAHTLYMRFFGAYPHIPPRDLERFTVVDHHRRVAFVCLLGDDVIAVGRYEGLADERADSAEVAFVVRDDHQGRGLGSILLEHLAAAARENGLRRFEAEVLAENQQMVRVFRDAGYQVSRAFADGVLHLEFAVDPTEASLAVRDAREQRAEARSVHNVLHPRSVAVIGASNDPTKIGHAVLTNLLRGDFTGPVYPVNPEVRSVCGVRAYGRVTDIPDEVDLAVVAIPAVGVDEVMDSCLAKGVHALVVISSGFADPEPDGGGGAGAQPRLMAQAQAQAQAQALVAQARAHGMRVIGPNALGVANTDPDVRLNATLAPVLPGRGRVGFFSQSGALGIAILAAAAQRGLGLSTFVSAGNRADVSGNDLLQYWQSDPATDVVLLYLETFGNPRKFARLARRLARTTPIVVVKSGRHSAPVPALAAASVPVDEQSVGALFEQAGVIRVATLTQLFDAALLLAYQPLPAGPRVAVVGNSTAIGVLVLDGLLDEGLVPAGEPVDVGADATPEAFADAVSAAARVAADALVVLFVPPIATPGAAYARALRVAVAGSGKPVVAVFLAVEGVPAELAVAGADGSPGPGSVPSYPSPERAVAALARAVRYARWRAQPIGEFVDPPGIDRARARELVARCCVPGPAGGTAGWSRVLSDDDAVDLLACYGIPAASAASAGGSSGRRGHAAPQAQSCVLELVNDPSFGSLLSFGLSGLATELLGDRAYRVVPVSDADAAALVRAPRAAPLLAGYGGAEPVRLDALEDLVLRLGRMAEDLPEIRSLALDPVLAGAEGAVVAGARIVLGPSGTRDDTGPRRLR